jgi:hypothetical protein
MIKDYIKAYKLLRNGRLKKEIINGDYGLSLKENLLENRENQKNKIVSAFKAFSLMLQLRKQRELINHIYSPKWWYRPIDKQNITVHEHKFVVFDKFLPITVNKVEIKDNEENLNA